ncbi:hypothetical protein TWF694_011310 [Orbilia ellipsospora]|uniref:Uncharacterized protein n=1 Tax=Orbilia ellipsospora TaxID=2528407 RepID=A0AAV9X689_9PEZI
MDMRVQTRHDASGIRKGLDTSYIKMTLWKTYKSQSGELVNVKGIPSEQLVSLNPSPHEYFAAEFEIPGIIKPGSPKAQNPLVNFSWKESLSDMGAKFQDMPLEELRQELERRNTSHGYSFTPPISEYGSDIDMSDDKYHRDWSRYYYYWGAFSANDESDEEWEGSGQYRRLATTMNGKNANGGKAVQEGDLLPKKQERKVT